MTPKQEVEFCGYINLNISKLSLFCAVIHYVM